jgi:hypothetical protein
VSGVRRSGTPVAVAWARVPRDNVNRGCALAIAIAPALDIRAGRDCIAAGEMVSGRLLGFAGVVEVALVRHERSPAREHLIECASVVVRDGRVGRYALDVPADVPPTAAGARCAIAYELTAKEALGDGRRASLPVTLDADGRPHLESRGVSADRLLANAPARRFHVELADAELRGGGRIAGRVHRHERWAPGAWTVEVSCVETWRTALPSLAAIPHWERGDLWSASTAVEIDPDRTWAPFVFDLPPDLPPAVEAHALAWRYELGAHRHARIGIDEYAVVTPLLFEADR